ncbi:MAG: NAD(P)H-dependent oxidoreductase subunit E [Oscillospiraceae bacterium]|jgi:NADH-quinone oxidoreductase E subunit|nr:NAD(P)H-dependent oxidoreductase subunit E [Oscillospiraceae bacterium]
MTASTTLAFKGTKEQEQKLKDVIVQHKSQKGALMPVLQEAQEIYGYMPREVQIMVAEGMGVTLAEVYGIVTFYSQFHLQPKGKYKVHICIGTACYVKGAGKILEKFERELGIKDGECTSDGKFSVDGLRCVGACGLAPVLSVNEDVYGKVTEDQVAEILANYKD